MITFSDLYEKTLSLSQRRKKAIKMKMMARSSIFQSKKKKSLMRVRDISKLQVLARKKVIQKIRDKFYKDYDNMSLQQRVKVDQQINTKYGAKIQKMTTKMVRELKGKEAARVKSVKDSMRDSQ